MSTKSSYKGNPPKYLNDFSKALASEVRILLQEVGKLRDERRALQFEIAELMAVKSKHGAGGEYAPDWKPKVIDEAPPPPPAPAAEEPADPAPAKPAWRTVNKKAIAHKREAPKSLPAPSPAPAPPAPEKPMAAWSTWKPNPLLAPTPKLSAAPVPVPQTPQRPQGLFGE
ncbi:hypothetical protein M422DRAFT_37322 [Sphaerobolus stellatus SS14]|uniref:Uncharacterized protein n=1 Tax=Sphaerobolus stellatus (strain SS14) TaxID=990650 RepID=A0A0C9UTR8_SPHS4|nr:hypothetical protein M422DRAFT_37322 [Sphaerobolus stellatus SS14]